MSRTHIGKLETELHGDAFAAIYSAYLGNTISLITSDDETEWLGPKSAEFSFVANGTPFSLLDVGYVEWTDDVGPLGAVLMQRRTGNGFFVSIEDVALAYTPALLRRVHLCNLSHEVQTITAMTPLAWTLRGRVEVLEEAPGALVCRSGPERGLFFAGHGLRPESESGALDIGRLVATETRALEPGDTWRLPTLWVAPFSGNVADAWLRAQGRNFDAARQWEDWDTERALRRNTPDAEA